MSKIFSFFMFIVIAACSKDQTAKLSKWNNKVPTESLEIVNEIMGSSIPLTFEAKKHSCFFGDYDFVRDSAKYRKTNAVITTIENLSKKSKKSFYKIDNIKNLKQGALRAGLLSRYFLKDGIYGVFLCSDVAKKGSCLDKPIKHIDELSSVLYQNDQKKNLFKNDLIFFFQPILISNSKIYIFKKFGKKNPGMKKFLSDIVGFDKNKSAKIVKKMEKMHNLLTNMPLKIKDDSLVIDLPMMNPKECDVKEIKGLINKFK